MNAVTTLSIYGYIAQATLESAWTTLVKLERQARRDTAKVVQFSDAAYRYLSSPTMIRKYRLFAKMSCQIAEIIWLVALALAATLAQVVESAQLTQAAATVQSNTEEPAQPQSVEQSTFPVEQFAIPADNSASPSAAIVVPDPIAVADPVIAACKPRPAAKGFSRNGQIKVQPNAVAEDLPVAKQSTIRELKKRASEAGIVGYSNMTKELLEALASVR